MDELQQPDRVAFLFDLEKNEWRMRVTYEPQDPYQV